MDGTHIEPQVYEALAEALTPPSHYWGAITDLCKQGWAQVWGRHRDSDLLETSNWSIVIEYLHENYELNEDFRVEGSSHWLVGWNDCLLVRALRCNCEDWDDADFKRVAGNMWECQTCEHSTTSPHMVFLDMWDFKQRIENYPVLNEEDYSRREHDGLIEYLEQEVGEEHVEVLARHLFDTYSVSRSDDISWEWIKEWKEKNLNA